MADKRIPFLKEDLTGDIQAVSGYVVALRSGTFASNTILGVEATEKPGYYDFTGIEVNVAYQLWGGTSADTMERNKAFSGDDGTVIYGVEDSNFLDPADFADNQIIVKKTISNVEQLIPYDLQDLIDDEGIQVSSGGVEYLFVRGRLCQDNSVYSGRAFFGVINVNADTGLLVGTASSVYQNDAGETKITIADYIQRSDSAKISTGMYQLQCKVGTVGSGVNGFATGLEGSAFNYKFEQSVIPIFGERTITQTPVIIDTNPIGFIQRYDATHVRIKLLQSAGVLVPDHTLLTYPTNEVYIYELLSTYCDILPLPGGVYTISSVTSTYIEILCNSTSGNSSFVGNGSLPIGGNSASFEVYEYDYTLNPILKGYLVIDTMTDPTTYYGTGKLLLRTYNTSWVLTDNILSLGYMVTIKANNLA